MSHYDEMLQKVGLIFWGNCRERTEEIYEINPKNYL